MDLQILVSASVFIRSSCLCEASNRNFCNTLFDVHIFTHESILETKSLWQNYVSVSYCNEGRTGDSSACWSSSYFVTYYKLKPRSIIFCLESFGWLLPVLFVVGDTQHPDFDIDAFNNFHLAIEIINRDPNASINRKICDAHPLSLL